MHIAPMQNEWHIGSIGSSERAVDTPEVRSNGTFMPKTIADD
jgi:hypothetical protein